VLGDFAFNVYQVTLKIYKECLEPSTVPPFVKLVAYINSAPAHYPYLAETPDIPLGNLYNVYQYPNSCATASDLICYQVAVYTTEFYLLTIPEDILITYQSGDRKLDGFVNLETKNTLKQSPGVMGYTFTTNIPGRNVVESGPYSSSPSFRIEYPLILCNNEYFQYDFSAQDADGDSLSYRFTGAYQGYDYATNGVKDHPPFNLMKYKMGFTPQTPLGPDVTINPTTGLISGKAPPQPGNYMVAVYVTEYRNKKVIGFHRKEMQFTFKNCTWPFAQIDSVYKNCNGTRVHFTNHSGGPIQTYYWDFGDPNTTADVSTLKEPDYTYTAPGVYQAKLLINTGTNLCRDSAFCTVIVDTGLKANFIVQRTPGLCNVPSYDFTNTSTSGLYPVTHWLWDFGDRTTTNDVSTLPNPTYVYPIDGSKFVKLIVSNDLGCYDTLVKNIRTHQTLLQAPNDTVVCDKDTIRLNAYTGYGGTYTWTPNYNISSINVPDPLVHPLATTMYYVTYTDSTGCTASDSVEVSVRSSVALSLPVANSTLCKGDTLQMTATHDGLAVTWQPAGDVTPISLDGSVAGLHPLNSAAIIATAHLGSCVNSDTINIKVVPPPAVTISPDTSVCYGAPVQLLASGGSSYTWSPAEFLTTTDGPRTLTHPFHDITYTVAVSDTLGCPKVIMDSVTITTFRGLFAKAAPDTMIAEGEQVQLTGMGGQYYSWTPVLYLSNSSIANPVASPPTTMSYRLEISNDNGCVDYDSVLIKVFKDPDIYVPTAFTPNGDGRNDLFYVYPVGFTLDKLQIFDRWGNLIFITSDPNHGWDGTFNGRRLNAGTFVWIATGKNKKSGHPALKKGTVTLVR
jgi:gliding motility-associated-like protein